MRYIPLDNQQDFCKQVWHQARKIPVAKVTTYGQIAKILGLPEGIKLDEYKEFGARWVGDAMATCPGDVPWQRVVNSQGKVSKRVEAQKQQQLLEEEGVIFVGDKLDLKFYQWSGHVQKDELSQASLF
jgi:methylated-DNA-protein-cysteine methyltransferase-like protein